MKTIGRASVLWGMLFVAAGCGNSTSPGPSGGEGGTPPPSQWRAAVGSTGAFLQTFDDQSWQSRIVSDRDLYAVTCVGNLHGWVAGQGGLVLRTDDGGATFSKLDAGVTADLHAVRFGDTRVGAVAGKGGVLAVTSDGGNHFAVIPALTDRDLSGVAVATDAHVIIAVGDGGTVLRSTDSGASFQLVDSFASSDLTGVAADAGAHLVLVVDKDGGIWSSTDRGAHFARETTATAALHGVALDDDGDDDSALAVGDHGTMLVRDSAGAWQNVSGATTLDLYAALVTDHGAYAAGASGTLLGSGADLHAGWRTVPTGTSATLYGLEDL